MKRKLQKEDYDEYKTTMILLLGMFVLILFIVFITFYFNFGAYIYSSLILQYHQGYLKSLVISETKKIDVEEWDCRDYAEYYNKTFTEKYPELEVRWIRYLDLCNDFKYCDLLHTYIIVSGYGQSCIVDQHKVVCVEVETNIKWSLK